MTSRFAPVPLVGTGPDLMDDIAAWIASEPLKELTVVFGADPAMTAPGTDDLAGKLAALDAFSERWDSRNGRERNLAGKLDLTDEQERLAIDAADAFGMRAVHAPRHDYYNYVLMLGGLMRACYSRPFYAAHLINSGTIGAESVVALGGHRPFGGNEFDSARELGISGVTEEYEALDACTRLVFGLQDPVAAEGEKSDLVGGTWGVRRYKSTEGLSVLVAAAPSSDPRNRRANTPDSLAWFAEFLVPLKPSDRVLMITNQIYVPAQHVAAVNMLRLPYGLEVETLGNDPNVTGFAQKPYTAAQYLQEVRSTLRALRSLHSAISTRPAADLNSQRRNRYLQRVTH